MNRPRRILPQQTKPKQNKKNAPFDFYPQFLSAIWYTHSVYNAVNAMLKWFINGLLQYKQVICIRTYAWNNMIAMGLLPDTENCRLRMRRECRERFPPPPISKETAS